MELLREKLLFSNSLKMKLDGYFDDRDKPSDCRGNRSSFVIILDAVARLLNKSSIKFGTRRSVRVNKYFKLHSEIEIQVILVRDTN